MTGISIGTAFGLLVVLMLVIVLIRLFSARVLDPLANRQAVQSAAVEAGSRDKALAAAIAVTALRSDPDRAKSTGVD